MREVHDNTLEGLWTGLRNFLRPFRGVNKEYLYQYVAIFEWGHNIKRVTPAVHPGHAGRARLHLCPPMSRISNFMILDSRRDSWRER